jgi:hypothetical protein
MRNVGSFGRSDDAVWIMTNSSSQEAKSARLALADSSMIEWRQVYRNPYRVSAPINPTSFRLCRDETGSRIKLQATSRRRITVLPMVHFRPREPQQQ